MKKISRGVERRNVIDGPIGPAACLQTRPLPSKRQRAHPTPERVALIQRYIEIALPGGRACLGRPFHVRRWWMTRGWIQPKGVLTSRDVLDHLEGRIVIAPRWPQRVNYFEIDIDAKDEATQLTLLERLEDVVNALDGRPRPRPLKILGNLAIWADAVDAFDTVPGIIWRSSGGRFGGLRYRVMLDRYYDRDELRERVLEALTRAGIEERGGHVESLPKWGEDQPCPSWGRLTDCRSGRGTAH